MGQAALDRFVENLPRRPWASNDLSRGIRPQPRDKALNLAYIQPNRPNKSTYLIFDIDQPGAALAWHDTNLPEPTISIMNPANGHAHLAYELEAPVYESADHQKPFRYLQAVKSAYTARLEADVGYVGLITKNPLCARWRVQAHDAVYELGYLAEFVDLKRLPRRAANDENALGRNCSLFDAIRQRAYVWVHECVSHEQLSILVLNACRTYNAERFSTSLWDAEVQCVARSISKWTWKNRHSIGNRKRRILELDPNLPLSERQSIGVQYVNAKRRSETEERIIQTIGNLVAQGKRATKTAVARAVGIRREALTRHYSHLFIGKD